MHQPIKSIFSFLLIGLGVKLSNCFLTSVMKKIESKFSSNISVYMYVFFFNILNLIGHQYILVSVANKPSIFLYLPVCVDVCVDVRCIHCSSSGKGRMVIVSFFSDLSKF